MSRRIFDVVLASIMLVILSPLFLIIAALIKLDSSGPVLYRARRMGKDFVPFFVWKFRSMESNADKQGKKIAEPGDRRITRVGKYLRLFKLDEVPQLFNVIRGEMSIIGPRPEECDVVEQHYSHEQQKVLSLKPGLTGLHQVTAFPDMTDEVPPGVDPQEYYLDVQMHNRLAVELDYLKRHNWGMDFSILFRTVYCLFGKSWLYLFYNKRVWIRQDKSVEAQKEMVDKG